MAELKASIKINAEDRSSKALEKVARLGAARRFLVAIPTLRGLQADIAAVFHWQPSEMRALPVREALAWRRMAVERALILQGGRGPR